MSKNIDGWQQLLTLCTNTKDVSQLGALFDLLLTPEEKIDISKRCLILRELINKNHSQREIAKNLNVSIAKITRGSNELKRLTPELLEFMQKNFE